MTNAQRGIIGYYVLSLLITIACWIIYGNTWYHAPSLPAMIAFLAFIIGGAIMIIEILFYVLDRSKQRGGRIKMHLLGIVTLILFLAVMIFIS